MSTPSVPPTFSGDLAKWAGAVKLFLDSQFDAPEPGWRTMPWARFEASAATFSRKPLPILVPDHPSGPSILIWLNGAWAVFTASASV